MKKFFVVILMVINYGVLTARSLEKSVSIYVVEEKINGIKFMHRSDLIDGEMHEIWAINGQGVTPDEYEEGILNAEREERRLVRQQEAARKRQEQQFYAQTHATILKKIITLHCAEITDILSKIREPLLIPYLKFDETTVNSMDSLEEFVKEISNIQKICQAADIYDMQELRAMLNKIEVYPTKLMTLYQDSLNHAIKTCDDTKILKDLLVLVS